MQREIKFRGFSEQLKCFVYGFFQEVEADGVGYSYIFWQGNTTPVRADSVSQFTGLYDKNGNEIYEGDILNGKYTTPLYVVYENGSFCFYNELSSGSDRLHQGRTEKLEVVGNIYENPELVTPKQA